MPGRRGDPTFTDKTNFLRRWWDDPQTYPDAFKSWLRQTLVQDPNIVWERSQIPVTNFSKVAQNVSVTPPTNPLPGDLWVYPGSGFYWMFLYDPTDATNPWKFVGGPPANVLDNTSVGTPGGNIWIGPTLTVPRAGRYFVTWSAEAQATTIHATAQVSWNIYVGNGSTTYQYSRFHFYASSTGPNFDWAGHFSGQGDYGQLAAGTALQFYLSPAAGWDFSTEQRSISLTPIRIS